MRNWACIYYQCALCIRVVAHRISRRGHPRVVASSPALVALTTALLCITTTSSSSSSGPVGYQYRVMNVPRWAVTELKHSASIHTPTFKISCSSDECWVRQQTRPSGRAICPLKLRHSENCSCWTRGLFLLLIIRKMTPPPLHSESATDHDAPHCMKKGAARGETDRTLSYL